VASLTHIMDVAEIITRKLIQEDIRFVFAGSVSCLIQGCEIVPGDIDLLVSKSNDVYKIVSNLSEFINYNVIFHGEEATDENWLSTVTSPIRAFTDIADNNWTFARLMVHDIKLEVANIQPLIQNEYIHGSGFWENGPLVWEHIKLVPYKDISLPVIPLEIQLETNMNRELESRIKEISRVFRTHGYNQWLVEHALNERNRARLQEILRQLTLS